MNAVLAPCALDPVALAAANVHPGSRLATDYLNHFNEVAMLLDMLGDMPDMAADVLDWRPRDYCAHFEATGFRDRAIVVAAYHGADPNVRARFDAACAGAEAEVLAVQARLQADPGAVGFAAEAAARLYASIAQADAVIHGRADANAAGQAAADALFGPSG